MANSDHITNRRGLLSAAGFTGLAAVAAVGWACPDTFTATAPNQSHASPDGELISLCAYFDELERQVIQSHKDDGEDEEAEAFRLKLSDRQRPLLQQIVTLRATTLEGARARAKMLRLWHAELETNGRHEDDYWNDQMVWALVSVHDHLESLESVVIPCRQPRFAGAARCGPSRTVPDMTAASFAIPAI